MELEKTVVKVMVGKKMLAGNIADYKTNVTELRPVLELMYKKGYVGKPVVKCIRAENHQLIVITDVSREKLTVHNIPGLNTCTPVVCNPVAVKKVIFAKDNVVYGKIY
jgi:hypothetical protein